MSKRPIGTYFRTTSGDDTTAVVKRLKRVERRAGLNKPEMKSITFSYNAFTSTGGTPLAAGGLAVINLSAIAQGNGISDRSNDKVRVWRIEVRGLSDISADHYIIQNHTTTAPTAAIFGSRIGAFLLDSENNKRFTEWIHYRNYYTGDVSTDAAAMKFVQKFPNGIIVKYNGAASTAVVDNGLSYCALNRSAGTAAINLSIRVWFTDH